MGKIREMKPRKIEKNDTQSSDPMIFEQITEQQIRRNDCKDKVKG